MVKKLCNTTQTLRIAIYGSSSRVKQQFAHRKCNFNKLGLRKIFYWTVPGLKTILLLHCYINIMNCKSTEEYCFVALDIEFKINEKIVDILLLLLIFPIAFLLPYATTAQVCFTRNYCVG